MAILDSERKRVLRVLEDLKTTLPVITASLNEYQITKSYAWSRPTFGQCDLTLQDPQFTGMRLYYFPQDWKWGQPLELLQSHFWLGRVVVKDPLPCVTKAPYFGGMGIYTILGDDAITERVGLRKTRLIGYRFKAEGRDKTRKALVARINTDSIVLNRLYEEFACGEGRPLPAFDHSEKALIPFGSLDLAYLEQHRAKLTARDLWALDDSTISSRLTQRLEALRPLAIYLQGHTPMQTPPPTARDARARSCSHCGAVPPVAAMFCGHCGQKLVS
jgi:hypothetical protein